VSEDRPAAVAELPGSTAPADLWDQLTGTAGDDPAAQPIDPSAPPGAGGRNDHQE
jgi:hypothetical protein